MWSYVYCSGAEEWRLPSTRVETINQSINQSIAINQVGDCSERTVLGFRSSLLVIIIIKNYLKWWAIQLANHWKVHQLNYLV